MTSPFVYLNEPEHEGETNPDLVADAYFNLWGFLDRPAHTPDEAVASVREWLAALSDDERNAGIARIPRNIREELRELGEDV
jgi:hypothetical protein